MAKAYRLQVQPLVASRNTTHSWNNSNKSFTIPKRKLENKDLLVDIPLSSREWIQEVLPILVKGYRHQTSRKAFTYSTAKSVHNKILLNQFLNRRRELRQNGYSEKEVMDNYGFLYVPSLQEAEKVCKEGLNIGNCITSALGHPEMGIQICRYSDILHQQPLKSGQKGYIIIFKVIKGKIKSVSDNQGGAYLEPTPNCDCHILKSSLENTISFSREFEQTQMYLYEYGELDVVDKPRQLCPVFVVDFTFTAVNSNTSRISERTSSGYPNLRPALQTYHSYPQQSFPGNRDPRYHATKTQISQGTSRKNTLQSDSPTELGTCVWKGTLLIKGTLPCQVELFSLASTLKPAILGTKINLVQKMKVDQVKEKFLFQVKTLRKNADIFKNKHLYSVCYLKASNASDCSTVVGLVDLLKKTNTAGVIRLEGDTDMLMLPESKLITELGISLSTSQQQQQHIVCIFINTSSRRQILRSVRETNQRLGIHLTENLVEVNLSETSPQHVICCLSSWTSPGDGFAKPQVEYDRGFNATCPIESRIQPYCLRNAFVEQIVLQRQHNENSKPVCTTPPLNNQLIVTGNGQNIMQAGNMVSFFQKVTNYPSETFWPSQKLKGHGLYGNYDNKVVSNKAVTAEASPIILSPDTTSLDLEPAGEAKRPKVMTDLTSESLVSSTVSDKLSHEDSLSEELAEHIVRNFQILGANPKDPRKRKYLESFSNNPLPQDLPIPFKIGNFKLHTDTNVTDNKLSTFTPESPIPSNVVIPEAVNVYQRLDSGFSPEDDKSEADLTAEPEDPVSLEMTGGTDIKDLTEIGTAEDMKTLLDVALEDSGLEDLENSDEEMDFEAPSVDEVSAALDEVLFCAPSSLDFSSKSQTSIPNFSVTIENTKCIDSKNSGEMNQSCLSAYNSKNKINCADDTLSHSTKRTREGKTESISEKPLDKKVIADNHKMIQSPEIESSQVDKVNEKIPSKEIVSTLITKENLNTKTSESSFSNKTIKSKTEKERKNRPLFENFINIQNETLEKNCVKSGEKQKLVRESSTGCEKKKLSSFTATSETFKRECKNTVISELSDESNWCLASEAVKNSTETPSSSCLGFSSIDNLYQQRESIDDVPEIIPLCDRFPGSSCSKTIPAGFFGESENLVQRSFSTESSGAMFEEDVLVSELIGNQSSSSLLVFLTNVAQKYNHFIGDYLSQAGLEPLNSSFTDRQISPGILYSDLTITVSNDNKTHGNRSLDACVAQILHGVNQVHLQQLDKMVKLFSSMIHKRQKEKSERLISSKDSENSDDTHKMCLLKPSLNLDNSSAVVNGDPKVSAVQTETDNQGNRNLCPDPAYVTVTCSQPDALSETAPITSNTTLPTASSGFEKAQDKVQQDISTKLSLEIKDRLTHVSNPVLTVAVNKNVDLLEAEGTGSTELTNCTSPASTMPDVEAKTGSIKEAATCNASGDPSQKVINNVDKNPIVPPCPNDLQSSKKNGVIQTQVIFPINKDEVHCLGDNAISGINSRSSNKCTARPTLSSKWSQPKRVGYQSNNLRGISSKDIPKVFNSNPGPNTHTKNSVDSKSIKTVRNQGSIISVFKTKNKTKSSSIELKRTSKWDQLPAHVQQDGIDRAQSSSTLNTPVQSSPTLNTPAYSSPTLNTPAQSSPTLNTPAQTSPTLNTPAQSSPTLNTPAYSSPTLNTPSQSSPSLNTPAQSSPTLNTPAYSYHTLNTPFQSSPTLNTPFQSSPTLNTPAYSSPTLNTLAQSSPTLNTPAQTSPTLNTPAQSSPTLNTPAYSSPTLNTPSQSSPTLNTPAQSSPTLNTPAYSYHTLNTPFQSSPTLNTPFQSSPTLNTPAYSPPTLNTPAQSSPTLNTPSQSSPTLNTLAQSSPTLNTPAYSSHTLNTPAQSSPTLNTPAYSSPTLNTPTHSSRTLNTPAQSSPTLNTPAQSSPTLDTPTQSSPTLNTHSSHTLNTPAQSSPTLDTPAQSSPTLNTIAQSSPTLNTRSHSSPTLNTPAHSSRTLNTPAQSSPTLNTPAQSSPTLNSPAQSSPTLNTPAQSSPTLDTPAQSSPTLNTPSQSSPTLETPDHSSGTLNTPAQSSPTLNTSDHSSLTLNTSSLNSPALNTPAQNFTALSTSALNSPVLTPAQSSPTMNTPAQRSPTLNTPAQTSPITNTSIQSSPALNTSAQSSPTINTRVQSSPTRNTCAQSSPAMNTPVQSSPALNTLAHSSVALNTTAHSSPTVNTSALNSPTLNAPTLNTAGLNKPALISPAMNTFAPALSQESKSKCVGERAANLKIRQRKRSKWDQVKKVPRKDLHDKSKNDFLLMPRSQIQFQHLHGFAKAFSSEKKSADSTVPTPKARIMCVENSKKFVHIAPTSSTTFESKDPVHQGDGTMPSLIYNSTGLVSDGFLSQKDINITETSDTKSNQNVEDKTLFSDVSSNIEKDEEIECDLYDPFNTTQQSPISHTDALGTSVSQTTKCFSNELGGNSSDGPYVTNCYSNNWATLDPDKVESSPQIPKFDLLSSPTNESFSSKPSLSLPSTLQSSYPYRDIREVLIPGLDLLSEQLTDDFYQEHLPPSVPPLNESFKMMPSVKPDQGHLLKPKSHPGFSNLLSLQHIDDKDVHCQQLTLREQMAMPDHPQLMMPATKAYQKSFLNPEPLSLIPCPVFSPKTDHLNLHHQEQLTTAVSRKTIPVMPVPKPNSNSSLKPKSSSSIPSLVSSPNIDQLNQYNNQQFTSTPMSTKAQSVMPVPERGQNSFVKPKYFTPIPSLGSSPKIDYLNLHQLQDIVATPSVPVLLPSLGQPMIKPKSEPRRFLKPKSDSPTPDLYSADQVGYFDQCRTQQFMSPLCEVKSHQTLAKPLGSLQKPSPKSFHQLNSSTVESSEFSFTQSMSSSDLYDPFEESLTSENSSLDSKVNSGLQINEKTRHVQLGFKSSQVLPSISWRENVCKNINCRNLFSSDSAKEFQSNQNDWESQFSIGNDSDSRKHCQPNKILYESEYENKTYDETLAWSDDGSSETRYDQKVNAYGGWVSSFKSLGDTCSPGQQKDHTADDTNWVSVFSVKNAESEERNESLFTKILPFHQTKEALAKDAPNFSKSALIKDTIIPSVQNNYVCGSPYLSSTSKRKSNIDADDDNALGDESLIKDDTLASSSSLKSLWPSNKLGGFNLSAGGIMIPDDNFILLSSPDELESLFKHLNQLKRAGIVWSFKVHSKQVCNLASKRRIFKETSEPHINAGKTLKLLTTFIKCDVIELLKEHECDLMSNFNPDTQTICAERLRENHEAKQAVLLIGPGGYCDDNRRYYPHMRTMSQMIGQIDNMT